MRNEELGIRNEEMILKRFYLVFFIVVLHVPLFPQTRAPELSGVLDTTVNYTLGAGDSQRHSWGIEEYANMRLRLRPGDNTILNAAFNFVALSGNFLETAAYLGAGEAALVSTALVYGRNYAAIMELERLFLRINGEYIDSEFGLLRMNFGYGQVWGSSDFLNQRNPLFPNARPRGVLGANIFLYPADSLKLMFFAAAPKNPFHSGGGGFIPGFSLDQHWDRLSMQTLYAYETPLAGSGWGIHRFGLSLKAELELGLTADLLYTLNPAKTSGIDGLSAGAGFDYSFFDGDLYVLFEYLFNGLSSVSARDAALNLAGWQNHHYLYGTALCRFTDYCSIALSALLCFDDLSFQPIVSFDYEFFQGFSLNIMAWLPLDRHTFSRGGAGELGPIPPLPDGSPGNMGSRFIVNAGVRLRF